MFNTSEVRQSLIQATQGTSEFRQFLEESFESIDQLISRQGIMATPVQHMGLRVKDQLEMKVV